MLDNIIKAIDLLIYKNKVKLIMYQFDAKEVIRYRSKIEAFETVKSLVIEVIRKDEM